MSGLSLSFCLSFLSLSPSLFPLSLYVIILSFSQDDGFKAVRLLTGRLASPRASISRDLAISDKASYDLTLEITHRHILPLLPLTGQKQVTVSAVLKYTRL